MDENVVNLVGHLAWPLTICVVAIVFRVQIREFLHGINRIKIGDITVALEHLTEKVDSVEAATKNLSIDLYRVTGDALKVREEIWNYVADILKRVSPETRFEMAFELNKYHFPRLDIKPSEVKAMLSMLGYFDGEDKSNFTDEVTREFVKSVYDFQEGIGMDYADGIVGPKTIANMKRMIAEQKSVQQENQTKR